MIIWLLAVVLIGGLAAAGFSSGAIRSLVALVGVILGLILAPALGHMLLPLMPTIGVASPLWQQALPPIIAFVIVWGIFIGLGFAAHRPVELHFKYREDDATRVGFERMNKALGVFVGLLSGIIIFLSAGRPIYSLGYLTSQLASDSGEASPISYVNQLRTDMAQAGWDKTFAALDKTPAVTYAVDDILGLIHANPLIYARLKAYPAFLSLSEKQEVADVFGDAEFQKLLQDKAGFSAIYTHPKTLAVLNSPAILDDLAKLDLKDFRTYLETGKSAQFDDEKILGRWRADVASTITDARRRHSNLSGPDVKALRYVLNAVLKQATLTAYPDSKFVLKVPPPVVAKAPEPAPAEALPQGMTAQMAARYRLPRGQQADPTAAAAAAAAAAARAAAARDPLAVAQKLFADTSSGGKTLGQLTTEGNWTRLSDKYVMTSKRDGKADEREASISDAGRLGIYVPDLKLTLFFVRQI
jgi:hypothetical protein